MGDYEIVTSLLGKATHYWDLKLGLCDILYVSYLEDELKVKAKTGSIATITISKIKLSESTLYALQPLNANKFSIKWTVPNEN